MKKIRLFIVLYLINCSIYSDYIIDFENQQSKFSKFLSILRKFERPITSLEICFNSEIDSIELAKNMDGVFVVLLFNKNFQTILTSIENNRLSNVVLLNPIEMKAKDIHILSRCEHFDVVLLDDFLDTKLISDELIDTYLNLGDYTFFKIKHKNNKILKNYYQNYVKKLDSGNKGILYYYKTKKNRLDIPRFTRYYEKKLSKFQYKIDSNFKEKFFTKKTLKNPVPWIPGINLITFVMLKGIYPDDLMISQMIENMANNMPYHNDLMIGNMILQGRNLVPIDFNDSRRNANMKRCIRRALAVFNGDGKRLENPLLRMKEYYRNKHV